MSGYIGTQPVPQATQTRDIFTATAGQTSFATGGYTPSFLDVYLNGVHLQNGTDYTASNGSDVVLTTGAAVGDVLEVVAYTTFELVNPTFSGTITASGTEPRIIISETDTSANHRIISSGGALFIQAEDSDGTTDGDMYLTGMNAQDLNLLQVRSANTSLTGKLTLPTDQYHYSSDGKPRLYHYNNGDTIFRTADDFQFRNNANATIAQIQDTGAISTISTVTATSFIGDGSALTGIAAGAGGGGSDEIFWENGQNVTTNYTITNGKNAMSAGPITIDSGVTVTVGAGETWTVV